MKDSERQFTIDKNLAVRLDNLKYKLKYESIGELIKKSFGFMFLLDEIEESPCELFFRDAKGKEHSISFYTENLDDEAKPESVSKTQESEKSATKSAKKKTNAKTKKRTTKKK